MKLRIVAWPMPVSLFNCGKRPPDKFNPQYYDEKKKLWRPYTVEVDGIMKPRLYDTRMEANQFLKVMLIKEKKDGILPD